MIICYNPGARNMLNIAKTLGASPPGEPNIKVMPLNIARSSAAFDALAVAIFQVLKEKIPGS